VLFELHFNAENPPENVTLSREEHSKEEEEEEEGG